MLTKMGFFYYKMGLKKGIWKWWRIFTFGLVEGVLGHSLLYYL